MATFALLSGCEVQGIVGSNVSAALEGGDGGGSGGGGDTGRVGVDSGTTGGGASGPAGTGIEPDTGGDSTGVFAFDVAPGDGPEVCLAPLPTVCDQNDDDPWKALGVDCPGGSFGDAKFTGHPAAMTVQRGPLGTNGYYAPRVGERMVVLSTGRAADLAQTHEQLGCLGSSDLCPSSELEPSVGLTEMPDPIDVDRVHSWKTCEDDPGLVGMGDCSNTLDEEWTEGNVAYDYAEVRLTAKVPAEADAFIYQFAFLSAEYPIWADRDSPWNDMYVAWLESEAWTGNISFDEYGHPISINGVFLDFLDAESDFCEECVAPELDGFAMDGHAGTRWLETTAPVLPDEEIEVVFAIFDLADAQFDSVVLLDAVHWGCTDMPPITQPEG